MVFQSPFRPLSSAVDFCSSLLLGTISHAMGAIRFLKAGARRPSLGNGKTDNLELSEPQGVFHLLPPFASEGDS